MGIDNYGDFLLNTISQFFLSMKAVFTGHAGSISENISIASQYTVGKGVAYVVFLTTFINFNLGIFNVIPFPPLDGWKGAEFTYEKITKKRNYWESKNNCNTHWCTLFIDFNDFFICSTIYILNIVVIFYNLDSYLSKIRGIIFIKYGKIIKYI